MSLRTDDHDLYTISELAAYFAPVLEHYIQTHHGHRGSAYLALPVIKAQESDAVRTTDDLSKKQLGVRPRIDSR